MPRAILEWAVERFQPRLTMATAFGAEGCVLIHLLAEIDPKVRVFNLDTGYQFPETLALREQIRRAVWDRGRDDPAGDERRRSMRMSTGGRCIVSHPDQCCYDRKIVPLRRALVGYDAWITAIRADQSSHRGAASVVGLDRKFGLVKVNPLFNWITARRMGVHRHSQRAVQSAPRPGICVDWLLAVHPCGGRGRRGAGGSLGGACEDRMRIALA